MQKAVFGMDLPLGSYYVEELQAPKGYLKSEIRLSVDAAWRADQREVVQWVGTIRNQPVLVQINLMDYHTEQELTGAVLRGLRTRPDRQWRKWRRSTIRIR